MLPDMGKRADIFSVRNQIDHLLRASPLTARKFPSPLDLWLTGLRIVTECLGLRTDWTEDFGLTAKLWLVAGNSDSVSPSLMTSGRGQTDCSTTNTTTAHLMLRITTDHSVSPHFSLHFPPHNNELCGQSRPGSVSQLLQNICKCLN